MQTILFLLLASCVHAQSTAQHDAKALWDQRVKSLAEANATVNETYRTALEKVYWRAVADKDPAAQAIRKELEILGPVRPQVVTPKSALPKAMVGKWDAVYIGGTKALWEFKDDGSCAITFGTGKTPSAVCTWQKAKDSIEVTFPDGMVTALAWPIQNNKIEGNDHMGRKVWLSEGKK